jgi:small-conductance mechanosensitive channel
LFLGEFSGVTELNYRGEVLLSVTEDDALWLGKPQDSLAMTYRDLIVTAVNAEREKRSWIGIWVKVGLIFLIVVGLFAMVKGINFLFRLIRIRVRRQYGRLFTGIQIKNFELLTPQRELQLTMAGLGVLRYAVILFSFYIALPLLFNVFPWTRGLAASSFYWIATPFRGILMGVVGYIPNFLTITLVFLGAHYGIKFLRFLSEEVEAENLKFAGFYPDWARPTFQLIRIVLYLFTFIIIFPYLPGSDSTVVIGVSVFLGLLFAIGSSSAVSNMVAGVILTYMRSFSLGDRVRIGEVTGDITEKSLLVTRLKTPKNEIITLPNSAVLSGHTVNYSTSADRKELILHTTITLGYDLDWRKAHELLQMAASRTEGVLEEPRPFVLQTALRDNCVAYELNIFTGSSHRIPAILSGMHQNIQDVFKEAGVEILSSPHSTPAS